LKEDWCLFWGAIIVSIFHSRKERKKNPEKKGTQKKRLKRKEKKNLDLRKLTCENRP